jgi:hypothetical protein
LFLTAAALALLGLLAPLAVAAQQPDIQARIEVDRTDFTLGDRVRVTVTVQHPADVLVDIKPPEKSTALRVIDTPPPVDTPNADGTTLTRFEFVLGLFALGQQQVPPLNLTWLQEDGTSGAGQVTVPPLNVRSTVAADDTVPRPLKPQLSVEGAPAAWPLAAAIGAGIVAAIALAAGAVWWRMHRRRPAAAVPVPVIAPLAEDQARRLLEEMARANPLASGDYDTYYGTISAVIRGYLQQRFEFSATALTRGELVRRMSSLGVERWQARLVGGLLDRCDSAVYARRRPDPASADHDLTAAFEIIELSRRPEEPAAEEEVA